MAQRTNKNGKLIGRPRTGKPNGRPESPAKILTRKKANEIVESGLTPLDVMVANMRFFHEESVALGTQIRKLLGKQGSDLEEVTAVLRKLIYARGQAQACAVDLAPYVHPRLAAVTLKNDPNPNGESGTFKIEFVSANGNSTSS